MNTDSEFLPSECPVKVRSGKYSGRKGRTISLPDEQRLSWVELDPKGRERAPQALFTRGQLLDLRPGHLNAAA